MHNDFIFAVVGEELGFIGAMALLATFCLLLWAGLKIAENAPDLAGRLIAAGCTSLLVIQLLLNVSGVVGAFPLSGKPVPFVSYGGSSVISSLMLVGLVMSVSMRSTLPETSYERRRAELRLADEDSPDVGVATPRSARLAGSPVRELRVVEGGATSRRSQVRPTGRGGGDSAVGLRRIDLGPSASERLRSARSRER
jgi:cell division protein FtsW